MPPISESDTGMKEGKGVNPRTAWGGKREQGEDVFSPRNLCKGKKKKGGGAEGKGGGSPVVSVNEAGRGEKEVNLQIPDLEKGRVQRAFQI